MSGGRGAPPLMTAGGAGDVRVFIGLGSNLHDPPRQIRVALDTLDKIPGTCVKRASSLYRSLPMGDSDQPDYVNAVAELATRLDPQVLLGHLQRIERAQGRTRGVERWQARTLDLDLLLYGNEIIHTPELDVPHPGIAERDFVLQPLYDLAPQIEIPGHGAVSGLLRRCKDHGLQRIDASAVPDPRSVEQASRS